MNPPTIEALRAHAPFLQRLARTLIRDEHQAEDIVQETMAAALSKPAPRRMRAWLAGIARRVAYKKVRTAQRRRAREAAVARPERTPSTASVAQRLETQSRLVEAVRTLPEIYRSVIVWRYFDDETPTAIATRNGVSVKTIETRLRRARTMLRAQLDNDHGGDGRSWSLALLCLIPESRKSALGWAAATTSGVVMTTNATLAGGVLVAVAAFFVGWKAVPASTNNARKDTRVDASLESVRRDRDALKVELSRAQKKHAALLVELEGLRSKEKDREEARTTATERAPEPEKRAKPEFVPEGMEEVLAAMDWKKIGESMSHMPPLIAGLIKAIENGDPMPANVGDIQRWNGPLITEALRAQNAGVTGTGVNGAFTNPAITVNVVFAALKSADHALNEEQARALRELGASTVERDRTRLAGYTEETSAMQKLVEETTLKERMADQLDELLTPEQRNALRPESIRGQVAVDLYGSSLVLAQVARPTPHTDVDGYRSAVERRYANALGLGKDLQPVLTEAVRRWTESLPLEFLETKADGQGLGGPRMSTAHVRATAAHQLRLHEELSKLPLSEAQRKALREHTGLYVPIRH